MTGNLSSVLTAISIPVAATLLGGVAAVLRPPGERLRSVVQHFAAGLVFAAVAGELLPEITREHQPLGVVLGFALGIGLMLLIERLSGDGEQSGARGLVMVVGVDILIDGLLIGISFAAGVKAGLLLTVALSVELLFLGLSAVLALGKAGARRAAILGSLALLCGLLVLGALVGGGLLAELKGMSLEIVLSFGAAALLYLVTEELLTEAHQVPETPTMTALFFVGFVSLFLVEMLL